MSALRARALRVLARRDHSRLELARKLAPAAPGEIEALLDELQARGWLSDQRVADQRLRAAAGRFGSRRVVQELTARGVAREVVAQASRQAAKTELASARAAWLKRFAKPPASLRERARQARFLEQRGFDPEVIRRVLRGEFEAD